MDHLRDNSRDRIHPGTWSWNKALAPTGGRLHAGTHSTDRRIKLVVTSEAARTAARRWDHGAPCLLLRSPLHPQPIFDCCFLRDPGLFCHIGFSTTASRRSDASGAYVPCTGLPRPHLAGSGVPHSNYKSSNFAGLVIGHDWIISFPSAAASDPPVSAVILSLLVALCFRATVLGIQLLVCKLRPALDRPIRLRDRLVPRSGELCFRRLRGPSCRIWRLRRRNSRDTPALSERWFGPERYRLLVGR